MMKLVGDSPMNTISSVVHDLGWTGNDIPETIVDMGGGHGTLCAEILRGYPSIKRGIVQDLDHVIEAAEVPSDLESRMELQTHNILTPQTVQADVYILRWILHDWPEPQCVTILRNLLPALMRGSTLIINEIVLPAPGQAPIEQERQLRSYDVVMKILSNAKERDEDDWRALLCAFDSKFRIVGIRRKPPALQSIIEVGYMNVAKET